MLMDNVTGWIRKLSDAGVAAIALAVVVQVIFGGGAAFLPGDVIATLSGIIGDLGSSGLVGLLAAALLYKIFTR